MFKTVASTCSAGRHHPQWKCAHEPIMMHWAPPACHKNVSCSHGRAGSTCCTCCMFFARACRFCSQSSCTCQFSRECCRCWCSCCWCCCCWNCGFEPGRPCCCGHLGMLQSECCCKPTCSASEQHTGARGRPQPNDPAHDCSEILSAEDTTTDVLSPARDLLQSQPSSPILLFANAGDDFNGTDGLRQPVLAAHAKTARTSADYCYRASSNHEGAEFQLNSFGLPVNAPHTAVSPVSVALCPLDLQVLDMQQRAGIWEFAQHTGACMQSVAGRESAESSPAHHTAEVGSGQRRQSIECTESSPTHCIAGTGAGAGPRRTDSSINTQDMGLSLLQQANLLQIITSADGGAFLDLWDRRLQDRLARNNRDCLDMAGKLTLSLKALDAGITADELLVDVAQAGGLHGKGDGMVQRCSRNTETWLEPLEIKSAGEKKGRPGTHVFKKVRTQGTSWKHLFLLGRPRADAGSIRGWKHASDFQDTMWLGYVTRHDFNAALHRAGLAGRNEVDVTLTPGSSRARSWLADSVKWIRLNALTCQWWRENIERAE